MPESYFAMTSDDLFAQIRKKSSYLCVGLDTDIGKIPEHLRNSADPIFEFNKQIIDATHDLCVGYKINVAFYEAEGAAGWQSLEKTLRHIPDNLFTIADAKRGDIGNTSALYAKAFFTQMNFDSVTVAPYMGADSVTPFLQFKDKWVILLAHTSNPGSGDFQLIESRVTGRKLYEEVLLKGQKWGTPDQLMFVVGATYPEKIEGIRKIAPDHFFLVPGIGAQGGDLQLVSRYGMNKKCGLLLNSSRDIIYASNEKAFAASARAKAVKIRQQMSDCLERYL